jgi:hypothetical protein
MLDIDLSNAGDLIGGTLNKNDSEAQVFIVIRAKSGFFFYV